MRNFDYHLASDVKAAEALLKAKEDGAKKVWLGVGPDRSLSISRTE